MAERSFHTLETAAGTPIGTVRILPMPAAHGSQRAVFDKAVQRTRNAPAVERALLLLEVLASSRHGLNLSELSRRLSLPKSSTYCLLLTLERCGYLWRNHSTCRYVLSFKLLGLANLAVSQIEFRQQATPFLRALAEKTGLTVHMAMRDRDEAVLIEKVDPPGGSRLATWIGKRMDLHCTGVGKALMAFMPGPALDRLIKMQGLTRYNDNTIISPTRLKKELATIHDLGYAFEDQEGEIGHRCIGAPVFDDCGQTIASISVAGTIDQITEENAMGLATIVKATATLISGELEFLPEGRNGCC